MTLHEAALTSAVSSIAKRPRGLCIRGGDLRISKSKPGKTVSEGQSRARALGGGGGGGWWQLLLLEWLGVGEGETMRLERGL